MPNPIRNLKSLPWSEALQVAAMVMAGTLLLEWLLEGLGNALLRAEPIQGPGWLSLQLPLLLNLLGGALMGWAATELWLYRQRSSYLQPAIVWTLIGSLILFLSLRWLLTQLPAIMLLPPALLTELNSPLLMCMIVGGFWRFWRDRFRR